MVNRVPRPDFNVTDENVVRALYTQLFDSWNKRDAQDYAALFEEHAHVVGFDGSQMNGRPEIETTLQDIFEDHQTGKYIGKIREVRFVSPDVAVLRAVSGIIPHGANDLNPALNSIQTLVASKHDGQWWISLFQNTPAQFHGRPEQSESLTQELRELL
jgi:uncharacterized protein (TIGR02246 family)